MNIIGDVAGRRCILFDDIVDFAGTLCNAAQALVEAGARRGLRLRHPRRALGRRGRAGCRQPAQGAGDHRLHRGDRGGPASTEKIRELTLAPLIGEAIRRIGDESSVSNLFD